MAVYTEVADDALAAFAGEYDIGAVVSCEGIAEGVENSNFRLRTERGAFILTLYEKRVEAADLPYFLGLMDHLSARDFPCPAPVHGRDGAALRQLAGRPAAIVGFLEGACVRNPDAGDCAQLGAAMAGMHLAGADFELTRANALSVAGWRPLFGLVAERADTVAHGLASLIEAELGHLEAAWPGDLPRGNIHADLFPDNVFFVDRKLSGIFDFYFACTDIYAYDLAVCLNAWCFEADGAFNVTKGRRMLAAYGEVRPLGEAEVAALPLLARGAALRFLLTRLFDWLNRVEDALVNPKDPLEYLTRLRFHQEVPDSGAYGLEK